MWNPRPSMADSAIISWLAKFSRNKCSLPDTASLQETDTVTKETQSSRQVYALHESYFEHFSAQCDGRWWGSQQQAHIKCSVIALRYIWPLWRLQCWSKAEAVPEECWFNKQNFVPKIRNVEVQDCITVCSKLNLSYSPTLCIQCIFILYLWIWICDSTRSCV